jgi:hypothetical protein
MFHGPIAAATALAKKQNAAAWNFGCLRSATSLPHAFHNAAARGLCASTENEFRSKAKHSAMILPQRVGRSAAWH